MDRDVIMRRALRASFAANLGAALLFAFPASLGQFAGFPAEVAPVYSLFLALLVAQFGLTYGWLARQPNIDRPLVVFSAIGKSAFVASVFLCWMFGAASGRMLLVASGDLAFVAVFAWWLLGEAPAPEAASHGTRQSTAASGPRA